MTEIHRLRQALKELLPTEHVSTWLAEPNEALDGFKPLEIVERGETDRLWRLIYTYLPQFACGKTPLQSE
jgi:hypothetical protein